MWRDAALIAVFVVILRLPFLNQAIQGDDVYYLAGAQHAQIDPLHPNHAQFVYLGQKVDIRGFPHPPMNAWILGVCLAVFGDIEEVRFHAVYIVFSLVAALSMYTLARRFTKRPLWATLLFLAVPAFVINGNSLEADVPHLAFWMAAFALYVAAVDRGRLSLLAASAAAMALAVMTAYQAVAMLPILAVHLWLTRRAWIPGWLALSVSPVTIALWQVYERLSTGALPLNVLSGHMTVYQTLETKWRSALALTAHLGWIVFPVLALIVFRPRKAWQWGLIALAAMGAFAIDPHPLFWISFGAGIAVLAGVATRWREQPFLAAWVLLFFAAALVLFFAGSARYLLPLAGPVAILVTQTLTEPRPLGSGLAAQLAVGIALAAVNYQHWDGYRQFAHRLEKEAGERRVWANSEWGLRYYLEAFGGLPLEKGQPVRPGEIVVSTALGYPQPFSTAGGARTPLADGEIRPALPLRLIGLNTRSGYSTASLGLRPFDITAEPIDRVKAELVVERRPVLEYLPMNAPEAESQIVSGIYPLEDGAWRWTTANAIILLKRPQTVKPVQAVFYIPSVAPARRVTVMLDGARVAEQTYPRDGRYTLASPPIPPGEGDATLVIAVDKTFSAAGDSRELGIILSEVGFR